jgi:hypothetical protein
MQSNYLTQQQHHLCYGVKGMQHKAFLKEQGKVREDERKREVV